jgi:hypothetical protein
MLLHHPQPRICEACSRVNQTARHTQTNARTSNEVEWIVRIIAEY